MTEQPISPVLRDIEDASGADIYTDAPECAGSIEALSACIEQAVKHPINRITHAQFDLLMNAVDQEYDGQDYAENHDAALAALGALHDFVFGEDCPECPPPEPEFVIGDLVVIPPCTSTPTYRVAEHTRMPDQLSVADALALGCHKPAREARTRATGA